MAPISSSIDFPIGNVTPDAPMRPIPLIALPSFHGLSSKDLDMFLFKFDIVCRGYNYITNAQKLKILPSTLKGTTLRWFMGLGGSTITSWEEMKKAFLGKYQYYCKSRDVKEEIFKFAQKEDENMEDCVE